MGCIHRWNEIKTFNNYKEHSFFRKYSNNKKESFYKYKGPHQCPVQTLTCHTLAEFPLRSTLCYIFHYWKFTTAHQAGLVYTTKTW